MSLPLKSVIRYEARGFARSSEAGKSSAKRCEMKCCAMVPKESYSANINGTITIPIAIGSAVRNPNAR